MKLRRNHLVFFALLLLPICGCNDSDNWNYGNSFHCQILVPTEIAEMREYVSTVPATKIMTLDEYVYNFKLSDYYYVTAKVYPGILDDIKKKLPTAPLDAIASRMAYCLAVNGGESGTAFLIDYIQKRLKGLSGSEKFFFVREICYALALASSDTNLEGVKFVTKLISDEDFVKNELKWRPDPTKTWEAQWGRSRELFVNCLGKSGTRFVDAFLADMLVAEKHNPNVFWDVADVFFGNRYTIKFGKEKAWKLWIDEVTVEENVLFHIEPKNDPAVYSYGSYHTKEMSDFILKMLRKMEYKQNWADVIRFVGYSGRVLYFDDLSSFVTSRFRITSRFRGPVDKETFDAIMECFPAIGNIYAYKDFWKRGRNIDDVAFDKFVSKFLDLNELNVAWTYGDLTEDQLKIILLKRALLTIALANDFDKEKIARYTRKIKSGKFHNEVNEILKMVDRFSKEYSVTNHYNEKLKTYHGYLQANKEWR